MRRDFALTIPSVWERIAKKASVSVLTRFGQIERVGNDGLCGCARNLMHAKPNIRARRPQRHVSQAGYLKVNHDRIVIGEGVSFVSETGERLRGYA